MNKELIRRKKVLGNHLRKLREAKGVSAYSMHKNYGMSALVTKAVEEGEKNYTIDALIKYLMAIDENEIIL